MVGSRVSLIKLIMFGLSFYCCWFSCPSGSVDMSPSDGAPDGCPCWPSFSDLYDTSCNPGHSWKLRFFSVPSRVLGLPDLRVSCDSA